MGCRFQVTAGAAVFYPVLYFFDSTGWFSALLPAVIAHEAGHALALRCCGSSIQTLRLEVTGLCMECSELFHPQMEAICAAAGPAAGLLWVWIMDWFPGEWPQLSKELSLGLSLFNLLPVLPLDGGRILLALTGREELILWAGRLCSVSLAIMALGLQQWTLLLPAAVILLCQIRA